MEYDLRGSAGNVFAVMGWADRQLQAIGKSPEEIKTILNDAKSGNYRHAIETIEKAFNPFDEEVGIVEFTGKPWEENEDEY